MSDPKTYPRCAACGETDIPTNAPTASECPRCGEQAVVRNTKDSQTYAEFMRRESRSV